MANNNDQNNKSGGKPVDPKRPYATIDLKATEVKASSETKPATPGTTTPSTATTASAAGAAATAAAAKASSAFDAASSQTRTTAEALKTAVDNSTVKDTVKDAGKASLAGAASTVSGTAKTAAAAAPVVARKGGGFLSHMAAGIAGAALTLGAGTAFWPSIAPMVLSQSQGGPDMTRRLAELERAVKERPAATAALPADIAQKLTATEARIGKVEQASGDVTSKIASEIKAAEERLAKQTGGAEAGRIAKLEETLSTLSKAAQADPNNAGRLPQLAAITGKLADLETNLNTRTTSLRQDVIKEVESRIASIAEASEAAKSGTARIDRDVSTMKTDAVRLGQRTERMEQTLKSVQEESSGYKTSIDGLKADLDTRLKSVAKPADVAAALQPVATKMATLEQNVQNVVKGEQDRNSNAERIVLSLELASLRRTLDRGLKYAPELAAVKKVAGDMFNLAPLEAAQNTGVPALPDLANEFRRVANAILDVDADQADASVVDRLLTGAKSIVRVRKVNYSPEDKGTEASVGRMETALRDNRLGDVLEEAKKIPPRSAAPAQDWLKKIEARHAVDKALSSLEAELKSSLSGGKGTK